MCAEEIKIEARVCRFCKSKFDITTKGYCTLDHKQVEADENGMCTICHGELIDKRVISTLIEETGAPPLAKAVSSQSNASVISKNPASEITELEILPIQGQGARYRFSAQVVDFMIWGTLMFFSIVVFANSTSRIGSFLSNNFAFGWPILVFLYYLLLEGGTGSTLGKRIYGLTVINIRGGQQGCTWGQAAIRTILLPFEMLIIGAIAISVTPRKQRIADLIAGTIVVQKKFIHKVLFCPPSISFVMQNGDIFEFEVQGAEFKRIKNKIWLYVHGKQGEKLDTFQIPMDYYPKAAKFNLLCEQFRQLYGLELKNR